MVKIGMRMKHGVALGGAIISATICDGVVAQEVVGDKEDPAASVIACQEIANSSDRLECYDLAAIALQSAIENKNIAIVSRAESLEVKRSLFGLKLPRINLFTGFDGDDGDDTVTGTIQDVKRVAGGKWIVQIDTMVWQTTETGFFQTLPKKGQKATVTRGSLGSFKLSVEGKHGLKAIRVR